MNDSQINTFVKDIKWNANILYGGEDTLYTANFVDGSRLTVLDRMTGFYFGRDIETGYRDINGKFWLASGMKDIRDYPSFTLKEAIEWVKCYANNCVGI